MFRIDRSVNLTQSRGLGLRVLGFTVKGLCFFWDLGLRGFFGLSLLGFRAQLVR